MTGGLGLKIEAYPGEGEGATGFCCLENSAERIGGSTEDDCTRDGVVGVLTALVGTATGDDASTVGVATGREITVTGRGVTGITC